MARLPARLAVPAVAVLAVAALVAPADAHGTCKATASPPVPALLTVYYSGAYDCTEQHGNLYVSACLEKSISGVTGWELIDCISAHAGSARHVHAFETTTDACVVGYYRAYAVGQNGDGTHYNVDYSPAVACAGR